MVFGIIVRAVVAALESRSVADPPDAAEVPALFHADPQHLWNRLHAALFVRVGADGRTYGQDRLEPLLWAESKHLLEERSNSHAAALLSEFLDTNGVKLIDDPLKRAILQRDLWSAPQHLRNENPFVNSIFLVFLRLPDGRAATEDDLKRLLSFDQSIVIANPNGGRLAFSPNPDFEAAIEGREHRPSWTSLQKLLAE